MPAAKPLAAEAETALRELAAQLKQSEIKPAVAALQLLGELGLDDDFEDLEASIVQEIRVADGGNFAAVRWRSEILAPKRRF